MQKKKMKNMSFKMLGDTKKINDNFSSEKSKFKSTMDVESHEAHKLKSDNMVSSASFKEISNNDRNFPLKGLMKRRSFQKDEKDNYSCNEIIYKDTKDILNHVHSPISKNIDHTTEMENENIQNISNLIETDEIKINSEELTNNITSFDYEKDKNQEREKVIFKHEDDQNLILDKEENETDISSKKVPLINYMQVLYDQNSERLKKRSQQMRKMKERLNIDNVANNNLKEPTNKKGHSDGKTNKVPSSTKVFIEKEENQKESIEPTINNIKDIKNDDTQLVISDLDCPIEEDNNPKIETKHCKNSLSMNLPSSKSFIQITNNLLIKSHLRQDNATSDYLLALNQCESQEENTDKLDDKSDLSYEKHRRFPSVSIIVIY